jgi:calcineurin-like phosphoesterase
MNKEIIIQQMITQMPVRFMVETHGPIMLNGVCIEIDTNTGKAVKIDRIHIIDEQLHFDEKE